MENKYVFYPIIEDAQDITDFVDLDGNEVSIVVGEYVEVSEATANRLVSIFGFLEVFDEEPGLGEPDKESEKAKQKGLATKEVDLEGMDYPGLQRYAMDLGIPGNQTHKKLIDQVKKVLFN